MDLVVEDKDHYRGRELWKKTKNHVKILYIEENYGDSKFPTPSFTGAYTNTHHGLYQ